MFYPYLHQSKCWQSIQKPCCDCSSVCEMKPSKFSLSRRGQSQKLLRFKKKNISSVSISVKARHRFFNLYKRQGTWQISKKDLVPECSRGAGNAALVTAKVRRKTTTKPTRCTFSLAAAASLPHHSHLQAQGCLSFMALLSVPGWALLRAAFEGDRHNPPSLPCWWVCGAGGADSWLLLPSLLEHRSSRA